MEKEKLLRLKECLQKESSLSKICSMLEMNELEVLGIVNQLNMEDENIMVNRVNSEIFLLHKGDNTLIEDNNYYITTDKDVIKLAFISDTRLCSKYQQLSILNDIYKKISEMGVTDVIHCGDISEGVYPKTSPFYETIFLYDVIAQGQYIVERYPLAEGVTTHFITGEHDDTHIKLQKMDIGKFIANNRPDMKYLGRRRDKIIFKNNDDNKLFSIQILHPTGKIPYTISYKPQQFISSMRSEDKADILLNGHWLQTEKLTFRGIKEYSVPSIVSTTPEMTTRADQNTIGAWVVTITLNEKKKFDPNSISQLFMPYYEVVKDDYPEPKVLKLGGDRHGC